MGLLDGRAVVITGAGRGLGRSFAMAVACEGAGVVVNDIDVDEAEKVAGEIAAEGGQAVSSGASVASWDGAGALVQRCVDEFGSLDGFVNNAVTYTFFGPPWEEDGDSIRASVEVNVMGALFCGARALGQMVKQRSGSLVNVSSRLVMGMPGMSVYCAAKGALASATYAQAMDAMPHNVRVNAFGPAGQTRAHEMGAQYAGYAKSVAESPDLCGPGVVYLLSDLSKDITGQLVIQLGRKLGLMRRSEMVDKVFEQDEWTAQRSPTSSTLSSAISCSRSGSPGPSTTWDPSPAEAP